MKTKEEILNHIFECRATFEELKKSFDLGSVTLSINNIELDLFYQLHDHYNGEKSQLSQEQIKFEHNTLQFWNWQHGNVSVCFRSVKVKSLVQPIEREQFVPIKTKEAAL